MTSRPLIFICYLAYLTLALYKHHLGVTGWAGVEDSLDELGRIRKTTLDFGGEKYLTAKVAKEIEQRILTKEKWDKTISVPVDVFPEEIAV